MLLDGVGDGLPSELNSSLVHLQRKLAAKEDAHTSGNSVFWIADTMVHRIGNESDARWYAALRMRSLLSHGNEDFESVAKSWHTGSGMLLTRVYGDEYDMVRARMDWHLLPGVTEEFRNDTLPLKGSPLRCGGNQFAVMAQTSQ